MPFPFTDNQLRNEAAGNGANMAPGRGFEDPKKANYAVLSIKDSKFSGDIKQDVKETIKMYEICSRQYGLSDRQKSDFFIHAFEGATRRFFMANTTISMPFFMLCEIVEKEYNSVARKLQVKATL